MISLLDVSFECHFIPFKVSGSLLQNFLRSWAEFALQLSRHMTGGKKFSQASLSAHGGRNLNHLIIICFAHHISHCLNSSLNIVGRRNRAFLPGCTCAVPGAHTACLAGCRFWAHPQLLSLSQVLLTEPRAHSSKDRLPGGSCKCCKYCKYCKKLFPGGRLQVQAVPTSLLRNWEHTWELIRFE